VSSRVDMFEQIRRDRRLDPAVSARTLAKRYRVSRATVGIALSTAVPPPRQPPLLSLDTKTGISPEGFGHRDSKIAISTSRTRQQPDLHYRVRGRSPYARSCRGCVVDVS